MKKYFLGWYFKLQNNHQSIAFIPAIHIDKTGHKAASIQVITKNNSYCINYQYEDFIIKNKSNQKLAVNVGLNHFSLQGIILDIRTDDLNICGEVKFSDWLPLKKDIMGPFKYVPFMQCRHSVISMRHKVQGQITLNDEEYHFNQDFGYIEGDRGRSFPKEYLWTHAFFDQGSLMLSVADIPFGLFHFQGLIAAIYWQNKTYIIATYKGAKIKKLADNMVEIKQGKYRLTVRLLSSDSQNLFAPVSGEMFRVIKENLVCRASYELKKAKRQLFSFVSDNASFEYEFKK